MLTLILAATIGQVYANDFYFIQAQEFWVIDQLPPHSGYTQFIPPELAEQIALWDDDCWRCRRNSNSAVVAMGPAVIRLLFWPLRSTNLRISMHAEAVINALIRCQMCDGRGTCEAFVQGEPGTYSCKRCECFRYSHAFRENACVACGGAGIFAVEPWRRIN